MNAACEAARTAYPLWSRTPWPVRADYLKKFGQEVERNEKGLARIVAQESGKALAEARADVVEARHMLEYAREASEMARGKKRKDLDRDRKLNGEASLPRKQLPPSLNR